MFSSLSKLFSSSSRAVSEQDTKLSELFLPVGKIRDGKLYSSEMGYYDNIEFKGAEGDTLVFVQTLYTGDGLIPQSAHWRTWPMSAFDLTGINLVKVIHESTTVANTTR